MNEYKYLFPFEEVPKNSKIIIYGAGTVGLEYTKQIALTNYCFLVAIIDKNYAQYEKLCYPVYSYEKIPELEFDYVVLAFKGRRHIASVKSLLGNLGIKKERIIDPAARYEVEIYEEARVDIRKKTDVKNGAISIMVNYDGGLGDNIARLPFINMLITEIPDCCIDLYRVGNVEFVKYLLTGYTNINFITSQSGIKENYDLAIDGIPRSIQIINFKEEAFEKRYVGFIEKIRRLIEINRNERFDWNTPPYVFWKRYMYKGYTFYTSQSCYGIFDITEQVTIPLLKEGEEHFEQLKLKKYITIGGGNGVSSDVLISKSWNMRCFEELTALIHDEYKDLEVIQVGAKENCLYKNMDKYIMGYPYEDVAWILKKSILHIDIDGGLVHLASQLGTKCLVLFGPTDKNYWGYKNNINISSDACAPCYGLGSINYSCVKGYDEPECMKKIVPSKVFYIVKDYLNGYL